MGKQIIFVKSDEEYTNWPYWTEPDREVTKRRYAEILGIDNPIQLILGWGDIEVTTLQVPRINIKEASFEEAFAFYFRAMEDSLNGMVHELKVNTLNKERENLVIERYLPSIEKGFRKLKEEIYAQLKELNKEKEE